MKTSPERFKLVLDVRRDFPVNGFDLYTVEDLPGTKPSYPTKLDAEESAARFYKRTGVRLRVQPFISISF